MQDLDPYIILADLWHEINNFKYASGWKYIIRDVSDMIAVHQNLVFDR